MRLRQAQKGKTKKQKERRHRSPNLMSRNDQRTWRTHPSLAHSTWMYRNKKVTKKSINKTNQYMYITASEDRELSPIERKELLQSSEFIQFFNKATRILERAINVGQLDIGVDYAEEENDSSKRYAVGPLL